MRDAHDSGGYAFPVVGDVGTSGTNGMTLRDYFAAKAMSILAPDYRANDMLDPEDYRALAVDVFALADAMLEARK